MVRSMITARTRTHARTHTHTTATYSASVVGHTKALSAVLGLELGLDEVGGLASVIEGELLQEALVRGLWEEALFVQQGKDAHLLRTKGRRGDGREEEERGKRVEEVGRALYITTTAAWVKIDRCVYVCVHAHVSAYCSVAAAVHTAKYEAVIT